MLFYFIIDYFLFISLFEAIFLLSKCSAYYSTSKLELISTKAKSIQAVKLLVLFLGVDWIFYGFTSISS